MARSRSRSKPPPRGRSKSPARTPSKRPNLKVETSPAPTAPAPVPATPDLGARVEVWWPLEKQFFSGKAIAEEEGKIKVLYDDGDLEKLDFAKETWRPLPPKQKKATKRTLAPSPNQDKINARFFKGVAVLLVPTSAPLFVANWHTNPVLCGVSLLLALVLAFMTISPSAPSACSYNKDAEARALKNVTITSYGNRAVRIAMGLCHLFGAVLYSLRKASSAATPFDLSQEAIEWSLVGGMSTVSWIWLSSGANGQ